MPLPDAAASRPDVASLSYEQARDELVEVVRALEAGNVPLEQSLALWERGEALAARCQEWLDGAKERLEAVQRAAYGAPGAAETTVGSETDERAEGVTR